MEWQSRTELLVGQDKLNKLTNSHVLVVGMGGVGAYAAEMLCRAGIGKMTMVDGDTFQISNRNRQLMALLSTEGLPKAEVMAKRFRDINPDIELTIINEFIKDEKIADLFNMHFDFVVDAIDTVAPKVHLLKTAFEKNIPIVSSMGAGGKMDLSMIKVADISKTSNCHLAATVRKRLRKLGVKKGIQCVFSIEEVPQDAIEAVSGIENKRSTVGTISYLPAAFGLNCAGIVIKELIK